MDEIRKRVTKTINYYNDLFAKGQLAFRPVDESEYDQIINQCDRIRWAIAAGCKVEIVEPLFEGVYLFYIHDDKVKYLLFDPKTNNEHWADENFKDIHFNAAKAHFASLFSGVSEDKLKRIFDNMDSTQNN